MNKKENEEIIEVYDHSPICQESYMFIIQGRESCIPLNKSCMQMVKTEEPIKNFERELIWLVVVEETDSSI